VDLAPAPGVVLPVDPAAVPGTARVVPAELGLGAPGPARGVALAVGPGVAEERGAGVAEAERGLRAALDQVVELPVETPCRQGNG
jgi:hypothetical protein